MPQVEEKKCTRSALRIWKPNWKTLWPCGKSCGIAHFKNQGGKCRALLIAVLLSSSTTYYSERNLRSGNVYFETLEEFPQLCACCPLYAAADSMSSGIAHFDIQRGKILCLYKPHEAMRKNFATRPLRIWKPKEEKAAGRAVRFYRSGICPIMFPPFLTLSARFNWTFFVARARIGTHAPQLPPRHLPTFTLSREIWPVYLN